MKFTETANRYMVVKSQDAPYTAYAAIYLNEQFIGDLAHAQMSIRLLNMISVDHEIWLNYTSDVIWLPIETFKDYLIKVAWEEVGNGAYCYADMSEEEISDFKENCIEPMHMEACSLVLTHKDEFYIVTDVCNPEKSSVENFTTMPISIGKVLEPYINNSCRPDDEEDDFDIDDIR